MENTMVVKVISEVNLFVILEIFPCLYKQVKYTHITQWLAGQYAVNLKLSYTVLSTLSCHNLIINHY